MSQLVEQFRRGPLEGSLDPNNKTDQVRYQRWIESLEASATKTLSEAGWSVDYLCVRRQDNLQLPAIGDASIALAAAKLGSTRLLDNLAC